MDHLPQHSIVRTRRLHRFRDVVTGLFSLIVVLGALSLTEVPIKKAEDLSNAVCYFAPMFFFIVALWTQVGELLDLHPSDDRGAEKTISVALFFAALVPVTVRISNTPGEALGAWAFDYFPFMMAAVFSLLAFCSHRLLSNLSTPMHPSDHAHLVLLRNRDIVIVALFLLSLPITPSANIFGLSLEGIVWTATFFVATPILKLIANVRGVFARKARVPAQA
jgi:hypothetical protein